MKVTLRMLWRPMGALYSQDIGDYLTLFIFNEKADKEKVRL